MFLPWIRDSTWWEVRTQIMECELCTLCPSHSWIFWSKTYLRKHFPGKSKIKAETCWTHSGGAVGHPLAVLIKQFCEVLPKNKVLEVRKSSWLTWQCLPNEEPFTWMSTPVPPSCPCSGVFFLSIFKNSVHSQSLCNICIIWKRPIMPFYKL